MKKFAYKITALEFDVNLKDDDYSYFEKNNLSYDPEMSVRDIYINGKINSLGKEGWEIVSVIDKKDKITFYFKKDIEN